MSYIVEKQGESLKSLHSLNSAITKDFPSDFTEKEERWVMPGYAAFRYAVTAFLALNNMLGVANDNALFDRLLG